MNDKTRAEFEFWASDEGRFPRAVERSGDGYLLAQTQASWRVWLAAKEKYEPRWISCEDRLPEDGDYGVLAFWDHGGMDMAHVQYYFRDATAGLDADGNQLYAKWYLSAGVTHWMPLPSAPSTQGGGE